ncbi:MAG: hypothetical protein V7459_09565 [Oceanicoccus sp.]
MTIFSHRLLEKSPVPPYMVGMIVSLSCFFSYLAIASHAGLVEQTLSGEVSSIQLRASLTLMILIGYLPVAHWYLRRWSNERIGELKKGFALQDEARVPKELILIFAGFFGWLAFVVLFLIVPDPNYLLIQPWNWPLDYAAVVVAISLVGWGVGRFSFELIWTALHLTDIAKRLPDINLLDADSFRPFTQQGVQSALLIIILMSITGHLAFRPGNGLIGASVFMTIMLVLTVSALIIPMRGIHKRIQARKCEELAVIREQIRRHKDNLLTGQDKTSDNLIVLLAMETRIERVPEWPFDIGSLSRFSFYLLLGLGSWVGAALVERLLNTAL